MRWSKVLLLLHLHGRRRLLVVDLVWLLVLQLLSLLRDRHHHHWLLLLVRHHHVWLLLVDHHHVWLLVDGSRHLDTSCIGVDQGIMLLVVLVVLSDVFARVLEVFRLNEGNVQEQEGKDVEGGPEGLIDAHFDVPPKVGKADHPEDILRHDRLKDVHLSRAILRLFLRHLTTIDRTCTTERFFLVDVGTNHKADNVKRDDCIPERVTIIGVPVVPRHYKRGNRDAPDTRNEPRILVLVTSHDISL